MGTDAAAVVAFDGARSFTRLELPAVAREGGPRRRRTGDGGPTCAFGRQSAGASGRLVGGAVARQRTSFVAPRSHLAGLRPLALGTFGRSLYRHAAPLASGVRRFFRSRATADGRQGETAVRSGEVRAAAGTCRSFGFPQRGTGAPSAPRAGGDPGSRARAFRPGLISGVSRTMTAITSDERLRRWRLILGKAASEAGAGAAGKPGEGLGGLAGDDLRMDQVLEALYDSDRSASLGSSCPNVNRWLGDIRSYFPKSVVQVMQQDALKRLNLQQMLFEPETLESVEADIHLIGTLLSLKNVIPNRTKETARQVVRKVVEDLERQLRNPLLQAVRGALHKASRTSRPKSGEIDWARTIQKNLKNYLPEKRTIIAERLVGYG